MTISKRVAKNTFFLLVNNVVSALLGFVVSVAIVRRLGVAEFGVFSFARSFPQLFLVIADSGLEFYMIREIAVNPKGASRQVGRLLPLKALLTAAALGATLAALHFSGRDPHTQAATALLAGYFLVRTLMTFFSAALKGLEAMWSVASLLMLESAAAAALIFFLVGPGDGAVRVAVLYCAEIAVVTCIAAAVVFRMAGFSRPEFDTREWTRVLAASWPFAISSLSTLIHNNAVVVMLGFFEGSKQVGLYASGVIILSAVGYIQNSISTSVYPVLSNMYVKDAAALEKTYKKLFKLVSITGLPLCIGAAVLAKPLLVSIFGVQCARGAAAFTILCAAYLFTNYAAFYSVFTAGIRQQKYYGAAYMACVAENVVLNFFFITKWGIEGAAAATVVSVATFILWIHLKLIRPYHRFNGWLFFGKLAVPLAAMAAAAYLLRDRNVFLAVAASGAVYAAATLIVKPYGAEDAALVRRALFGHRR